MKRQKCHSTIDIHPRLPEVQQPSKKNYKIFGNDNRTRRVYWLESLHPSPRFTTSSTTVSFFPPSNHLHPTQTNTRITGLSRHPNITSLYHEYPGGENTCVRVLVPTLPIRHPLFTSTSAQPQPQPPSPPPKIYHLNQKRGRKVLIPEKEQRAKNSASPPRRLRD